MLMTARVVSMSMPRPRESVHTSTLCVPSSVPNLSKSRFRAATGVMARDLTRSSSLCEFAWTPIVSVSPASLNLATTTSTSLVVWTKTMRLPIKGTCSFRRGMRSILSSHGARRKFACSTARAVSLVRTMLQPRGARRVLIVAMLSSGKVAETKSGWACGHARMMSMMSCKFSFMSWSTSSKTRVPTFWPAMRPFESSPLIFKIVPTAT
mmetsp:Transcript_4797/g.14256  ORF Transcript_4797/g.14256 Transcript_4797/m.14256 type:complete len:209 (+) Transcript_4797:732-1358(+)